MFALALAALFGAGTAAGSLLDPDSPGGEPADGAHGDSAEMDAAAGAAHAEGAAGEHGAAAGEAPDPVRGLSASENGFTLEVGDPERASGAEQPLRFRVLAEDGSAVTDFDVEHTKRMHLIVVRRDLTRFQHLHPRMSADGTWEVPLELGAPGTYRAFADFASDGETTTLASDLTVPGAAPTAPLPAPRPGAVSDGGYDVSLATGPAAAGEPAELEFEVSRDGRPVEIEPYLGADGHLVALREDDLAFLHVHPLESEGAHPGEIAFEATFPTAGSYRLFLQFRVGDEVETVAFTKEVE
jgi:hypothetical protein